MVTLEQLEALDLAIWLRTTDRAAELALTNQSTISRRSRAALETFGLSLCRTGESWGFHGDIELLELERLVHQRARLHGLQPLRLQVPFWTHRMAQWHLPAGWRANPPDPAFACEDPVRLLRERVIDACLITSCQRPLKTDGLVVLEVYRRPIELTLFFQTEADEAVEAFRHQRDAGGLTLEPMQFLPSSCSRNAAGLFRVLTGTAPTERSSRWSDQAQSSAVSVSFLTPEMREVQERPWRVNGAVDPCLYEESLVVLADIVQEHPVQSLINQLLPRFESLSA